MFLLYLKIGIYSKFKLTDKYVFKSGNIILLIKQKHCFFIFYRIYRAERNETIWISAEDNPVEFFRISKIYNSISVFISCIYSSQIKKIKFRNSDFWALSLHWMSFILKCVNQKCQRTSFLLPCWKALRISPFTSKMLLFWKWGFRNHFIFSLIFLIFFAILL